MSVFIKFVCLSACTGSERDNERHVELGRMLRKGMHTTVHAECLGVYNGEKEKSYCVAGSNAPLHGWSMWLDNILSYWGQECAFICDHEGKGWLYFPSKDGAAFKLEFLGDTQFTMSNTDDFSERDHTRIINPTDSFTSLLGLHAGDVFCTRDV